MLCSDERVKQNINSTPFVKVNMRKLLSICRIVDHHCLNFLLLVKTNLPIQKEAVMVVIEWQVGLQLPMQSVPITTNVVSSNPRIPLMEGVLDTTFCDKVCQWLAAGRWFSPSIPVSSTNKTDRHNITDILLKVALNTMNQTKPKE